MFFTSLAAALSGSVAGPRAKLGEAGNGTWLGRAMRALERLAGEIGSGWLTGRRWPTLRDVYETFTISLPPVPSFRERSAIVGVRLALQDIAVDLCLLGTGNLGAPKIGSQDVRAASGSPLWSMEAWLETFSDRPVPVHSAEGAEALLELVVTDLEDRVVEFSERAAIAAKAARFALDHRLHERCREELRRVADRGAGYRVRDLAEQGGAIQSLRVAGPGHGREQGVGQVVVQRREVPGACPGCCAGVSREVARVHRGNQPNRAAGGSRRQRDFGWVVPARVLPSGGRRGRTREAVRDGNGRGVPERSVGATPGGPRLGTVMDPSLGLLLERLRWPVPRVRWEAARAVARLVRAGDDRALDALLAWTAKRTLESECLLGLGVIHAFDLADFCPEDTASRAVSKPSLASDWLLRTVYNTRERSAPFRYAVSPQTPARLNEDAAALFDRLKTWAVPPVFLRTLERLEGGAGLRVRRPMAARLVLDLSIARGKGAGAGVRPPPPGSGEGRDAAHAARGDASVRLPPHTGVRHAHGQDTGRPGRIPCDAGAANESRTGGVGAGGTSGLAPEPAAAVAGFGTGTGRGDWAQAGQHTRPGETPAALHVVEAEERGFIEVEVDVVLGHGTLSPGEPVAEAPKFGWEDAEPGCMGGDIHLREARLGPWWNL